jgi:hypothetical protein
MTTTPDLLLLRLDALKLDNEKVRVAVERAQVRGQFLAAAREHITPCKAQLRTVQRRLRGLRDAMEDEPQIAALLTDASFDLDRELQETPELIAGLVKSVQQTVDCLDAAMVTAVSLDDRSIALRASLNRRCDELGDAITELRDQVRDGASAQRRDQWKQYQSLLDDVARPVFMEYVDFLGGLTVRDTGLDDRVCEMTDALLTRFKGVTQRSLPLPARQAALGNALDSVVLLGFPEWSIWGIPLVGHEVGLAYAKNQNDPDLVALIRRFVSEEEPSVESSGEPPDSQVRYTEEYVLQLLADAFATYTLGLAYACAALLLRLSPRHDEPHDASRPRDIDRARVIMMTLLAGGETAPGVGGSFSDAVGHLRQIWEAAVRAHAGPAHEDAAMEEAQGPPPYEDWLDDFSAKAVEHFRGLITIRAYDNQRWTASDKWHDSLRDDKAGPGWTSVDDAVPDALTAAWRLRLVQGKDPAVLAADLKERWSEGRKGA